MSWLAEHWLALALIAGYSALLLWHGVIGRRDSKNLADYYVGGRRLSGMVVGISFFATYASTNSYIGNAGQSYAYGMPWLLLVVFMVGFAVISWYCIAPRLRFFTEHFDVLTLPDLFRARFGGRVVGVIAAIIIIFASLLYLVAIFKGAGNLFQVFLGIPYAAAVGGVLVLVIAYTSMGGFFSVVRTDVVQGVLMVIGSALLFYYVTAAAGGVGAIFELDQYPSAEHVYEWDAGVPFAVLLGIVIAGSMKLLVEPRQISRFFALRDAASIRTGVIVAVVGILLIQALLLPIGLYAHALLSDVGDTDLIVPRLVASSIMPGVVAEVLVLAMVAAAMSSLDSVLLVTASVAVNDLWVPGRRERSHDTRSRLRATRLCVVLLAVVAALIALRPPGGIVALTIFSGSLYAACFFPPLVLGLFWRRGDWRAATGAFLTGLVVLLVWLVLGLNAWLHELFPALLSSLLVYVVAARATAAPQIVLAAFTAFAASKSVVAGQEKA